ncbi:MAG TPA: GHMP kinase [Anaerolineae bacterium]|jgi:D-glycero-alpha-D-manno-heptose-7-phosphate kinase|nr:GHMP kinase [Anaerolineae bacterium]
MIVVQTPLRVSFFGGGTDFRSYFETEGGCVLSTAIDKYIFVTIKKRFDQMLRVGYTRTELVEDLSEIQHELIREALRKAGIQQGIEIATMGDIPSAGTGLGSSSTVTVGALHAAYGLLGELVSAEQLAREACEIEIDILSKPIGIQDQYIAAYGGFRFLEFTGNGQVLNEKIELEVPVKRQLNENLMLFFTGVTRSADTILREQKENISRQMTILNHMKQIAFTARDAMKVGDLNAIGELLHESWELKRQLASGISNGTIQEMYQTARRAGAIGGKITGAGGGGFLLLYCPHEKQESVRAALNPLKETPFKLESDGSKVIFNYHR